MLILYIILAYLVFIVVFVSINLSKGSPKRTLASDQNKLRGTGIRFNERFEHEHYSILHVVEDGIERITYKPKEQKYETPILMLHGMWHGAWCWEPWQKYLAEEGWETVSFSLPGHGKSTLQRPIFLCTLDYYLAFFRDEIERLPQKPIIMGHSMGGALSQWALKYLNDKIKAVVLVAPWVAKNAFFDGLPLFLKLDPIGVLLTFIRLDAGGYMRSPKTSANALITAGADHTPEELHAKLGNESALVLFQQMPPFWYPPKNPQTPILLAAGVDDAVVSFKGLQASAQHYDAEFIPVHNTGHNLMMEKSAPETIEKINAWLKKKESA